MPAVCLITLDPGHFHAALVQKEMYAEVDRRVHVYAPLGPDLAAHLQRLAAFNTRQHQPTAWELEVHAGPDYLQRLARERPGSVVVLAGRNDKKIAYLETALDAGLHVLADKPWIISAQDFPRLQSALDLAERGNLVVQDIMTERHEITSLLQRELAESEELFGTVQQGAEAAPAVLLESVHYLKKTVAGQPLRRPAWFFDINRQGEGLTDVGTHLVDLAPWLLWPGRALRHDGDVAIISARRWPTLVSRDAFRQITGESDFPPELAHQVQGDQLAYFCNNEITYRLCGIHVRLVIRWDVEAQPGSGDSHLAVLRGTRARLEIRQGPEERFQPELYVVANEPGGLPGAHVLKGLASLQAKFPGLDLESREDRFRIRIPEVYRTGHEAHFAAVTRQFLGYLAHGEAVPAWEKPNLLAKYFLTTAGVDLARKARAD